MRKRILTVVLTIALVLSMAPVTVLQANAAGGRTVYFENTAGWSNVNIYFWSSSNTSMTGWPGKAMTLDNGKIYSYDLPDGVEFVIFNNGSTQTSDLPLPSDKNMYIYASGTWSHHGCAHVWGEETVITNATCTENGSASYTCSACGESKTAAVPALGHSFVGNTCSRCGMVQKVIYFDATGSGWTKPYIYTWSGSTNECGAWPGATMQPVEGVEGLFCYGLSELPENVIFNNGNGGDGNQTADLVMPTDGKNLYIYSGGSWSEYDSCPHSWDEGTVTTAATCTQDGVLTYSCTLCGDTDTEVIPAAGHSFENGSCTVCGAVESCTEHSWDDGVVTEEESCWLPGTRTYTCTRCGATKDEYIYPSHDRYVAQIIEPTCTSTGKEITKCTRCAYSYDRTLPKIDHSYVAGEVVAPTCTEDGYTVYTCSACSATTNGDKVYHTGHGWSGNTCTTCGTTCEHTYADGICTSCGNGGPAYVQGYYEIANAAQLYWFAAQVNSGNNAINGKLVADIDLKGGTWTSIGYYCSDTLIPDTVPYTGIFDGQGHTVSNFTTAGIDNEGLFGYCSSATIRNVGVINAKVTGWRAGAVAGYPLTSNVSNCFAKNCTITGKTNNSVALLSGTVYIAPVVSPQGGIVSNCYALDCTLIDDTDLEVYATPVGGTDTQNGYYCNITYTADFDSVRNSTEVTLAQLSSGEVTYLLNKGITDGTQAWYQTCGTGLPAHSGLTVYQVTGCGTADVTYSNDPSETGAHSYDDGVVTTAPTCSATGIKTYTCTGCGETYTEVLPTDDTHSYENGICTGCGGQDPDFDPVVVPELTLKYPTVSFEDVIVMNVYYTASSLENVVQMGLIAYSSEVSEWNVENAEQIIPGYFYDAEKQMYMSTTNGIAAKNLGDTLYFAVYAELTDGTYTYTKLVSYSPETYAYTQLTTGSANVKPLVVAMLKYGAAAQSFFGHNTDTLVDRNLTAGQLALVESYRADMMASVESPSEDKQGSFLANGGFTGKYPTVSFEGAFEINYYCVPANTPAEGVTMYYWNQADYDAAEVLTAENAIDAITMTGTDTYQAAIKGIAAKDLDRGIYVAFVYSDGTATYSSGVLAYSIGTYCTTNAAGTADVAALAQATAVYGYYAKNMFYV